MTWGKAVLPSNLSPCESSDHFQGPKVYSKWHHSHSRKNDLTLASFSSMSLPIATSALHVIHSIKTSIAKKKWPREYVVHILKFANNTPCKFKIDSKSNLKRDRSLNNSAIQTSIFIFSKRRANNQCIQNHFPFLNYV